jgi:hypothetical protein
VEERYMDDEKKTKILEVDISKPGHHVSRSAPPGQPLPPHAVLDDDL